MDHAIKPPSTYLLANVGTYLVEREICQCRKALDAYPSRREIQSDWIIQEKAKVYFDDGCINLVCTRKELEASLRRFKVAIDARWLKNWTKAQHEQF